MLFANMLDTVTLDARPDKSGDIVVTQMTPEGLPAAPLRLVDDRLHTLQCYLNLEQSDEWTLDRDELLGLLTDTQRVFASRKIRLHEAEVASWVVADSPLRLYAPLMGEGAGAVWISVTFTGPASAEVVPVAETDHVACHLRACLLQCLNDDGHAFMSIRGILRRNHPVVAAGEGTMSRCGRAMLSHSDPGEQPPPTCLIFDAEWKGGDNAVHLASLVLQSAEDRSLMLLAVNTDMLEEGPSPTTMDPPCAMAALLAKGVDEDCVCPHEWRWLTTAADADDVPVAVFDSDTELTRALMYLVFNAAPVVAGFNLRGGDFRHLGRIGDVRGLDYVSHLQEIPGKNWRCVNWALNGGCYPVIVDMVDVFDRTSVIYPGVGTSSGRHLEEPCHPRASKGQSLSDLAGHFLGECKADWCDNKSNYDECAYCLHDSVIVANLLRLPELGVEVVSHVARWTALPWSRIARPRELGALRRERMVEAALAAACHREGVVTCHTPGKNSALGHAEWLTDGNNLRLPGGLYKPMEGLFPCAAMVDVTRAYTVAALRVDVTNLLCRWSSTARRRVGEEWPLQEVPDRGGFSNIYLLHEDAPVSQPLARALRDGQRYKLQVNAFVGVMAGGYLGLPLQLVAYTAQATVWKGMSALYALATERLLPCAVCQGLHAPGSHETYPHETYPHVYEIPEEGLPVGVTTDEVVVPHVQGDDEVHYVASELRKCLDQHALTATMTLKPPTLGMLVLWGKGAQSVLISPTWQLSDCNFRGAHTNPSTLYSPQLALMQLAVIYALAAATAQPVSVTDRLEDELRFSMKETVQCGFFPTHSYNIQRIIEPLGAMARGGRIDPAIERSTAQLLCTMYHEIQ